MGLRQSPVRGEFRALDLQAPGPGLHQTPPCLIASVSEKPLIGFTP